MARKSTEVMRSKDRTYVRSKNSQEMNLSDQEKLLISKNCEKVFERGQADKIKTKIVNRH